MNTQQIVQISLESWGILICLAIALSIYFQNKKIGRFNAEMVELNITLALLLLFDISAICYRGKTYPLAFVMVRVSNCAVLFLTYILVAVFIQYVYHIIKKRGKNTKLMHRIALIITSLGLLLCLLNVPFHFFYYIDENNYYHRTEYWFISLVLVLISLAIEMGIVIRYRKQTSRIQFISMILFMTLPVIMAFIQLFFYGLSLINISYIFAVIIFFFISEVDKTFLLAEQEKKLAEYNIRIMHTQIQPHFLFNTLSTIEYLCKNDPDMAAETIEEFSIYLRNNIDFAGNTGLIPFSRELEHIKIYMDIEKKRFGQRVNIEYHIDYDKFSLPPLVIQPLIENAVKHGIARKRGGGTIILSTCLAGDYVSITVEDNGIGFDLEADPATDRAHIGLENVRERVEMSVKGRVEIFSAPGRGTRVQILLPIKEV